MVLKSVNNVADHLKSIFYCTSIFTLKSKVRTIERCTSNSFFVFLFFLFKKNKMFAQGLLFSRIGVINMNCKINYSWFFDNFRSIPDKLLFYVLTYIYRQSVTPF